MQPNATKTAAGRVQKRVQKRDKKEVPDCNCLPRSNHGRQIRPIASRRFALFTLSPQMKAISRTDPRERPVLIRPDNDTLLSPRQLRLIDTSSYPLSQTHARAFIVNWVTLGHLAARFNDTDQHRKGKRKERKGGRGRRSSRLD
jgi:hypothetical protein